MINRDDYTITQDNDCHWYWIPNDSIDDFNRDCAELEGKVYMDCPDKYDEFCGKYEHFRTYGAPSCIPPFLEE